MSNYINSYSVSADSFCRHTTLTYKLHGEVVKGRQEGGSSAVRRLLSPGTGRRSSVLCH